MFDEARPMRRGIRRGLHDTDDGDRFSSSRTVLADDARVAAEVLIQNSCVSTITGATPVPSSRGHREPAEHGRESHDVEVVAGHETDVDARWRSSLAGAA